MLSGGAQPMNVLQSFELEVQNRIADIAKDRNLQELSRRWVEAALRCKYPYNFFWLGRPVIQLPQDLAALQELVWRVKPDLIIETGIAHGGSLVFSASLLALIDYCEAVEQGRPLDPKQTRRRVLGVDIDIRARNREAIEAHPLSHRIDMIQGSSIAEDVIEKVQTYAKNFERIFVCLDSNHTYAHVLAELNAYAPLTSKNSYCVVFDTIVEDLPESFFTDRPWSPKNSPGPAVRDFLSQTDRFVVDSDVDNKLLLTCNPRGFLKCVKD
jgi:cephalosporin hydroxylase